MNTTLIGVTTTGSSHTIRSKKMMDLSRKMEPKDKIILDLCGGTGAWSQPYVKAGYDVRVITLPYLPLFDTEPGDVREYEPPPNVYGILAAPVCRDFTLYNGNASAPIKRDFKRGMELVNACLNIIWKCRFANKLAFWAIENPKAYLRQFLGKAPYSFEQWEFGDNGIKPTEIWGYFKFPKKTIKERPKNMKLVKDVNGRNRKAIRAITPPGFAQAFFKANK